MEAYGCLWEPTGASSRLTPPLPIIFQQQLEVRYLRWAITAASFRYGIFTSAGAENAILLGCSIAHLEEQKASMLKEFPKTKVHVSPQIWQIAVLSSPPSMRYRRASGPLIYSFRMQVIFPSQRLLCKAPSTTGGEGSNQYS